MGYLENSLLIKLIEYYAHSEDMQIKKEKKVYCADNALHSCYYGLFNQGALAENATYIHLSSKYAKINYWNNHKEVDFIVEKNNEPTAIEVKYQEEVKPEDLQGINSFFKHYPKCKNAFIVTKKQFKKIEKEGKITYLIPLWLYLLL